MNALQPHTENEVFTSLYLGVREKENRLFSDEELYNLPSVPTDHPHYKEWQVRNISTQRLLRYINRRNKPMRILEVGCGNGWLSHALSSINGCAVTGLDINFVELQQACRVFAAIANLDFYYGSLEELAEESMSFDIIVFAASIQYFKSLSTILDRSLSMLRPKGEIHILDSSFYESDQLAAARARTVAYYENLGIHRMASHYFHHSTDDLKNYECRALHKSNSFSKIFRELKNPFPWYAIKKSL